MKIELELKLTEDNYNSYPSDSLIIENGEDCVYLELTGYDRKIAVDKEDLKNSINVLI